MNRGPALSAFGLRELAAADSSERLDAAQKAFNQYHLLWTAQHLLDVYGRPDQVESDGDHDTWIYENRIGRQGSEQFVFYMNRSTVSSSEYQYQADE